MGPGDRSDNGCHGCNTPCIELRDDAGHLLVLDAGSGIVGLGHALGDDPQAVPILLTHYHWDHLQGLPFFAPIYRRGWMPTIWAPSLGDVHASCVDSVFEAPFFPLSSAHLPARPVVRALPASDGLIAGFHLRTQTVNHPGGALAYRIRGVSGDLVYATDHEFGDSTVDAALARFVAGASALILDAHFTPDELPAHAGWGHSSWRQCAEFARASGVERLWLFHHKPGRADADLSAIRDDARNIFEPVDTAREGDSFAV